MKRPPMRLAVALIGSLTVSLIATTSFASYRTAMGPKQCCKSHCRREKSDREAQRCCKTHLTVLPAAVSKGMSAKDVAPTHVSTTVLPAMSGETPVSSTLVSATPERAPPPPSLFAQHTSLLV